MTEPHRPRVKYVIGPDGSPLTVAEVERDLILETLRHCLGNRTRAAAVLGISIRTLRNKLNDYAAAGVAVPRPRTEPSVAA